MAREAPLTASVCARGEGALCQHRHVSRILALVVAIALVSCATQQQTAETSLVPLVDPGELPVTTIAPTTTVAPSSDPNSPIITTLPETECAFADILPAGEITFMVGDRLYGASLDGSVIRCLATLQTSQRGPVKWSPLGNRALLNTSTMFDAKGQRMSGFDVSNTRVQWERPAGDAAMAPSSSNKSLVHREADDTNKRTEITFLSRTLVAVSHPVGGSIIAAGTSAEGVVGVFAAANGAAPHALLTTVNPDLRFSELALDAVGDIIYVLSDDGVSFRIHQLQMPTLAVVELTSEQAPILQLTTGPTGNAVAWKVGLCNSITETRVRDDRTAGVVTVGDGTPLEGLSLAPVGWLDATRLVVASRPLGCDGPADVWIWNLLDGSATLIVKTVEFPATRTTSDLGAPIAIDPSAQPPAI
jgi:hypothetical protein